MKREELRNIPGLQPEDTVVIWKMNYGFKSDLQGEISDMNVEKKGDNIEGTAKMDIKKMKIYNLVFGILEAPCLNIPLPKDLAMGLSQAEKDNRIRVARSLEGEIGPYLFDKISALNKEPSEEIKKK